MAFTTPEAGAAQEEEWQELQAVLLSGILDKAPNLKNFLEYVAEKHFSGNTEQVKEYSIAVQALHRLEQFDPQSDTIVRVTAHTLRKKLEQYYATEGVNHPVQIRLPAGKYVLQFEHKQQVSLPAADPESVTPLPEQIIQTAPGLERPPRTNWMFVAILGATGLLVLAGYLFHIRWSAVQTRPEGPTATARSVVAGPLLPEVAGSSSDRTIRIRLGGASKPYLDAGGQTWLSDQYCQGGSAFSHPDHEIQGTDDPTLFQQGREGKFQCRIPVPAGSYQMLLLFADTAGDKVAARYVDLAINNVITAFDIVDEAGSDDTVVGKVFTGIHPMSDGTIHLDFTSDGSFGNAVELTPSASESGAPLRMIAGPAVFHDNEGNTWLPERFFQGGRRTFRPDNLPKIANAKLFEWERYGHFRYTIPVVAGKEYRVKLYFSEGWFGVSNGGTGGPGSRVFDVYCNGTTLLKDFDILQSQQNGAAVMTFDHVSPTAHGILELDFTPVKNYSLINAIEIEPTS